MPAPPRKETLFDDEEDFVAKPSHNAAMDAILGEANKPKPAAGAGDDDYKPMPKATEA